MMFACGFPNGDSKVATPTEETLCKFPRDPAFQLMDNPWPVVELFESLSAELLRVWVPKSFGHVVRHVDDRGPRNPSAHFAKNNDDDDDDPMTPHRAPSEVPW